MRVLILFLNQLSYQFLSTGVVMLILFQPVCFSPSGFNPLQFFQDRSLFIRSSSLLSQVVFVFSHPPALFLSDSIFIQEFSFLCASTVCSFLSYPVFHCEDLRKFVSYLFILVFLTGEFNSVIHGHHILFNR